MKSDIRYKMKIKRKYFGQILRSQADIVIFETFFAAFGKYDSFFIYSSFSTEARTDLIIGELLRRGKRVYLPRVEGQSMVAVPYFGGSLTEGFNGIPEPEGQAFSGGIDVTVAPLLCVNPRGFRLGYGGGYYDRYLCGKATLKVGLGYGFQIEEFNEEPHDVPLDKYICERGIYDFGE